MSNPNEDRQQKKQDQKPKANPGKKQDPKKNQETGRENTRRK